MTPCDTVFSKGTCNAAFFNKKLKLHESDLRKNCVCRNTQGIFSLNAKIDKRVETLGEFCMGDNPTHYTGLVAADPAWCLRAGSYSSGV